MRKFKIKAVCILLLLLICIMGMIGCTGSKIAYTVEDVNMQIDTTYNEDKPSPNRTVNSISDRDGLISFFDNAFFDNIDPKGLEMFDEIFFDSKDLLIISLLGDKDTLVEISNVTTSGTQLFVHMITSNNTGKHVKYIYKFISIEKDDVKDISRHGYVIRS